LTDRTDDSRAISYILLYSTHCVTINGVVECCLCVRQYCNIISDLLGSTQLNWQYISARLSERYLRNYLIGCVVFVGTSVSVVVVLT
jgi:hypothetical protein